MGGAVLSTKDGVFGISLALDKTTKKPLIYEAANGKKYVQVLI
jgi:hypothetical protein